MSVSDRNRGKVPADALLRAIVTSSNDAICTKDLNGVITSWNKSAERMFGYTEAEAIGRTVESLIIPPERHQEEVEILQRIRDGEHIDHFETERVRKDGTRIEVSLAISPIRNTDGTVVGASKVARDITQRRKADAESALLSAIVDSSDDAIISKSFEGVITSWNHGAQRIFGYDADEIIGESILTLIPEDRHHEETDIIERLKRGERVDHFETVRVSKDGRLIDISLTVSPIYNIDGQVIGASKIARDITERRRTEEVLRDLQRRYTDSLEHEVQVTSEELQRSQERLRIAERMAGLGTLSSGLGHDLGNVLMPLRAHVDAVAAYITPGNNGVQQHFEAIRESLEYLRTLSNGLRMLAIDPNREQRSRNPLHLDQWWRDTQPLLKTALGRQFTLRHDIPNGLPPVGIPTHLLTQAVFNLVQNAAQAMAGPPMTHGGAVEIRARHVGDEVHLIVSDNGPGMTREVKDHCFEPYYSTKPRSVSTGLGLALVHGIMESACGTVSVESEPGDGATFTLRIPTVAPRYATRLRATLKVSDRRVRALCHHLLSSLDFDLRESLNDAEVLISDDIDEVNAFLIKRQDSRAVLIEPPGQQDRSPMAADRVSHVPTSASTAEIRQALARIHDDLAVRISP